MKPIIPISLLALCLPISAAQAQFNEFRGKMVGTSEVPALSTAATGEFRTYLSSDGTIHWQLAYNGLEGTVTQAHIHIGQRSVNGGVSAWLCSNLGTPGVQPCPAPPARFNGIITTSDVVGPAAQGIAPGEFAELVRAMRNGTAYANVHSTKFPGGEIRTQIKLPAP